MERLDTNTMETFDWCSKPTASTLDHFLGFAEEVQLEIPGLGKLR